MQTVREKDNCIQEQMSNKTFAKFSTFVYEKLGIKMPDVKKTMLQARLQKRMRRLDIESFDDYYDYLFSEESSMEMIQFMDVVTTNKTDFFREPRHFEYLVQTALPELMRKFQAGTSSPFRVWSAGCSSGKEPYTLAIVLSEFAKVHHGFKYAILATDICTKVLNDAKSGIYEHFDIEPIPIPLRKRYLLRSKDNKCTKVRIVPELRKHIHFHRLNFMDNVYSIRQKMDMIFCRNVIIYGY